MLLVAGAQRSMRVCLCSSVTLRQLNHSITVFEIISLLLEIISLRRVRRGRESVTPWVRPWVDSGLFSVQIVNIEHVLPHSPPPFSQRNRNSRGSEYSWNGTEERCHSLTLTITHTLNNTHNTRRWRWIGHVLRMPPTSLPRVAHRWTPDGRRNRGRPKETWRRTVETEMKKQGWAWVTWRDVLQTDHAGGLRWRPHALPSVKRIKRREE